ncbi:hypothetical protein C7M61_002284 [Candidozyma pseudohaemuli]|uniref:Uncharacterized protein n=1 Tax=Candidozyma pseudohaemuli TaxID=418784 RepID=A0A2P7YSM1_9ASCO|nr:hypothetical protein C7M61_002284 [[Candida] pseudohaemulonii]PSK38977.1 hypothetical protein C7M61_002284 [[Candida] pseudohaemulonii]
MTSENAVMAKESLMEIGNSMKCGDLDPILNVTESDPFEGYNCGFAAAEAFFNDGVKVTQILKVANFRTVSRCWVPAQIQSQQPMLRFFSSRQRCINFNNVNEHDNGVNLISNDDVFASEEVKHQNEAPFEPTVFSSEDVFTAGPVNKA